MKSLETYYVDGPVIFTTHPLNQLVRRPQTWFGLQHVLRLTYYGSIEDYELLLYFIVTDQIDIRVRKDSFNSKFKFFLTYEETLSLLMELQNIAKQIVNQLIAGQPTTIYSFMIKNRVAKFQGFISEDGSPIIEMTLEEPHSSNIATVRMTLSKFQEFVACLQTSINNWHHTVTLAFYQFDKIGKSLLLLQNKLNEIETRINHLENQILNQQNNTSISQIVNQSIETNNTAVSADNQLETQQETVKHINLSDVKLNESKVLTKFESLMNKVSQTTNSEKQSKSVNLTLVDSLDELMNVVRDIQNVNEFVHQNFNDLQRILKENGVPDRYIESEPLVIRCIHELKDLAEGKEPVSALGYVLQSLVA